MKIRELHEGLFDTFKTNTPTSTIKKTKNQFGFNINDLTDNQKQQLIDYITHLENPQISTVEPVNAQPKPGQEPPAATAQPASSLPDISQLTKEELLQLRQQLQAA